MTKWNDIPYDEDVEPEVKGLEFELQYEENKRLGEAKENSDQYRPEPRGRAN